MLTLKLVSHFPNLKRVANLPISVTRNATMVTRPGMNSNVETIRVQRWGSANPLTSARLGQITYMDM